MSFCKVVVKKTRNNVFVSVEKIISKVDNRSSVVYKASGGQLMRGRNRS